jgi:AraC-like DNA-binding protein
VLGLQLQGRGRTGQEAPVASVARALEIGKRHLERRFLHRVGLTPKRYTTLRRFERAVSRVQGSASLTSDALEAGYYDQSHLIREFRCFAGTTPTDYLKRPR